jgi:methylmalonyl-CoA mutase C-terminal domain/subunit
MTPRLRVLVTKIGLGAHDRGSRLVAWLLRDAGMEVVHTPSLQTLDHLCALAMDENVDVVGISSLATDHLVVPQLMEALRNAGLDEIGVVVSGIVPDEEQQVLRNAGVYAVGNVGAP